MTKDELKRLQKIEKVIYKIAKKELNLDFCDIEFDIIKPQKMLEIMAYNIPTNISNWKKGRDYERQRTIYEHSGGLPYEVVINSDPSRAYFMNSNPFAIQVMVMAHVVGHVAFFTMNDNYQKTRKDIIETMSAASKRFNDYERKYGIKAVEEIVDAGHALQSHCSPFENETEKERKLRVFELKKKQAHSAPKSLYTEMIKPKKDDKIKEDVNLFNHKLWQEIKHKTPVEPVTDLLRFIIDNSTILEDWQKDILEVLRKEGQYYWPMMRSKFMNEGFAVYVHEYIMDRLFEMKLLKGEDYTHYARASAFVKAKKPISMNPYLIGSKMWEDIKYRWDTGRYGSKFENLTNREEIKNWDTKEKNGWKKIINVMKTYTDWFFMKEFLTPELVNELDMYIFVEKETSEAFEYNRTKHTDKQIADIISNSFATHDIPHIVITDGNLDDKGGLKLVHKLSNKPLDTLYSEKTMDHIKKIWGRAVELYTHTK